MRVNLGCGDRYAPGWHNVDHAGSPHPKDEAVDLRGPLPWLVSEGITHAYAGHILEHLFVEEVLALLDRLRPCMVADGELMVVGPDVLIAEAMAATGTLDVTMESLTSGGHRWPGDEHRWHCTGRGVRDMLLYTGWTKVLILPIGEVDPLWPVADRGPQWQCAVSARPI
jgi:predicted SAM-dependent methyltransferase